MRHFLFMYVVAAMSAWSSIGRAEKPDPSKEFTPELVEKFRCNEKGFACVHACTGYVKAPHNAAYQPDDRVTIRVVGPEGCKGKIGDISVRADKGASVVDLLRNADERSDGMFAEVTVAMPAEQSVRYVQVTLTNRKDQTSWMDAAIPLAMNKGHYILDFGFGVAVILDGDRKVIATPYRSDLTDRRLAVTTSDATSFAFFISMYPFGHERDTYGVFEGVKLRNFVGLQVGTALDTRKMLRTGYAGAFLEPVTGLTLGGGVAILDGEYLKPGNTAGTPLPETGSETDLKMNRLMLRPYVSVVLNLESLSLVRRAYAAAPDPTGK